MKAIDDFGLIPMSFNLGSELHHSCKTNSNSLTPMPFYLGSEPISLLSKNVISLTPMSFNLDSEPLFSNLYLIVT